MNFSGTITDFDKDPYGFYFDMNMTDRKNCSLIIRDTATSTKLEMEINCIEDEASPMENDDADMTQADNESVIVMDKYDCFCCLQNYCPVKRIFTHEFHFSFFVDRELNTYYVVNDFENCSDEYPVDDTYCQELEIFPEILKLLFVNPPKYVGHFM